MAPGYPRLISADFSGLPNNLNAAFTWTNGRTYFFKGSKYWRFTNFKVGIIFKNKQTNKRRKHSISFAKRFRPTRATRRSCPKVSPACRRTWTRRSCGRATARSTSSRCVRVVELVEQTRKKTETKRRLGSQGSKYWRFDPTQKPPVKSTYPKDVSNWEGLPNGLDGALAYTNGYSYFFKDGSYWRFNDRSFKVGVSATNHERCRR